MKLLYFTCSLIVCFGLKSFVNALAVRGDAPSPVPTARLDNAIVVGGIFLNGTVDRYLGIPYGETTWETYLLCGLKLISESTIVHSKIASSRLFQSLHMLGQLMQQAMAHPALPKVWLHYLVVHPLVQAQLHHLKTVSVTTYLKRNRRLTCKKVSTSTWSHLMVPKKGMVYQFSLWAYFSNCMEIDGLIVYVSIVLLWRRFWNVSYSIESFLRCGRVNHT